MTDISKLRIRLSLTTLLGIYHHENIVIKIHISIGSQMTNNKRKSKMFLGWSCIEIKMLISNLNMNVYDDGV